MNAQQADNLRILIRHMETKVTRTLNMQMYFNPCGTPACALGEAVRCGVVADEGCGLSAESYPHTFAKGGRGPVFGLDQFQAARLFGMDLENTWRRRDVTAHEWAAEARKVLAENGYSMDEKPDAFRTFMAKVQEPVAVTA